MTDMHLFIIMNINFLFKVLYQNCTLQLLRETIFFSRDGYIINLDLLIIFNGFSTYFDQFAHNKVKKVT